MHLPPGIQDIIGSFYSTRNLVDNVLYSSSSLLTIPRDYLITQVPPNQDASVEYNRSANVWLLVRRQILLKHENLGSIMGGLETSTLFYAFYFSMTPFESNLAELELIKRQWRPNLSKSKWFQRSGNSSQFKQGSGFEIGNYKMFDAFSWTVEALINHNLDYSTLSLT